ncbi:PQQ-like beta-propeller repeat protein [Nocardioides sp. TF02-7]|uniref:PQQ-like beta-propeller repeat protein n=1 Tax=Nocardioides sp. TF02-7 TaxID=2917724 RepID=UPI001F06A290|nr:PQQ-like beta-propeller repeat protein [Nocardioides sp. TF02-7]UMG94560.1 PQQ-like beta-propeller repeat protein [Nocardioides sp. TF02-7]
MPKRPLTLLTALPAAVLVLATAACDGSDAAGRDDGGDAGSSLVPEDASVAWTVTLEEDWSPVQAVAAGDVTVVSTSWEIDEGSEVTAYRHDGSVAWVYERVYGGALLAPVGDDAVLVCDDDEAVTLAADDGSVVEEGPADDERCPGADDEEGIPVPRDDEAYTVAGEELVVDGPDGGYTIALEDTGPEIWGVEGGVVTFDDATDQVRLYR